MAKLYTPAMEAFNKKYNTQKKKSRVNSPFRAAMRRLFRNKTAIVGMAIIAFLVLIVIFADLIAPYEYQVQNFREQSLKPCREHPFGTDALGRDMFSRVVIGARYSLCIGLLCLFAGVCIGGLLGVIAGYFGGRVDNTIMRIMDVFQAIPGIMLTIAIVAAIGNGIPQLVFAMSIGQMTSMSKSWRAEVFTVKGSDYIESSRAIGESEAHIIVRHLVPNFLGIVIIGMVSGIGGAIMGVSSLAYLGLGIQPPTPEWGALLSAGKDYIRTSPHMVLFPGIAIAITVIAFTMFGQGLRDALDPKLK